MTAVSSATSFCETVRSLSDDMSEMEETHLGMSSSSCLRVIAADPYVAGSDIIGEEVNDILELRSVIRELVGVAETEPGFVIRIHAGENDSLRDNVANSIRCVAESLRPGQSFPPMRVTSPPCSV